MRAIPPSSALKLCVSPGVPSHQLAILLALQRAEAPETPVVMEEVATSADLIAGMKDGRYDIGLATTVPTDEAPLWRDELAIAVPDRSPLLSYTAVPSSALRIYPLLQSQPLACEALFGEEWRVSCQVTSYELMIVMVAAGYGVGIGSRLRIEQSRNWDVVMRPLADGTFWIGTHLFRSERRDSPAIEHFVRRARKVA
ncbi:substrate-binding domain-containing protein [Stenotrophomonas sp. JC08]|uniref:substrate-binding domain-containing protein n=1 Tax=Stenotrophomonas sp. JC08 TaxID=3445779 RepID=UPI003FA24199